MCVGLKSSSIIKGIDFIICEMGLSFLLIYTSPREIFGIAEK